jgi:hypothetical protein
MEMFLNFFFFDFKQYRGLQHEMEHRFLPRYIPNQPLHIAPQSIPAERSSPGSQVSPPALRAMSCSALAEHCMRELRSFRCGKSSNDQYGLELFRRATMQRDQQAWESLQQCFSEIVLGWTRRHPNRDIAYRLDSEENYVAQAFERFWLATAHNSKLEFSTLAAALEYLRASLNGAILDTLRTYSRPKEMQLPEPGKPGEPLVEGPEESSELWELLQSMFPNKREQRLAYLFFHCGLKPRDIIRYCYQEFSDVREIYRLRRNITERLLRNADHIRWRLGTD